MLLSIRKGLKIIRLDGSTIFRAIASLEADHDFSGLLFYVAMVEQIHTYIVEVNKMLTRSYLNSENTHS